MRDADGDETDLRQDTENAAQIVGVEEHAVRADLEQDDEENQEDQPGEFRFFEIDLEQALQVTLRQFEISRTHRRRRAPPMQSFSFGQHN